MGRKRLAKEQKKEEQKRTIKPPVCLKEKAKPVQTGYNSPVSSTETSSVQKKHAQAGKDEAKLSKSQRARLRKRLAKERKKKDQKYSKEIQAIYQTVYEKYYKE